MNSLLRTSIRIVLISTSLTVCGSPFAWSATSKSFSALVVGTTSASPHVLSSPDSSLGLNVLLAPSYQVSPILKIALQTNFDQSFQPSPEFMWNDSVVSASRKTIPLNPYLGWAPSLRSTIPTSKKSRVRDSLLTAVGVGNKITYSLGRLTNPLLKDLSGFVDVKMNRLIHQFTTSTTGASNNRYSISTEAYIEQAFTESLSASLDFIRIYGLSYANNRRDAFALDLSASYQAFESVAFSVGVSNAGSTLRSNGFDSNISLFDPQSATAYGSLTYVF